jgi:hypothetical protein
MPFPPNGAASSICPCAEELKRLGGIDVGDGLLLARMPRSDLGRM